MRRVLLLLAMPYGCQGSPSVDLVGPSVVAASLAGPRTVEVPVAATIELWFSEPLDPETVHGGSVALVPFEDKGPCLGHQDCDEAVCEAGHCQEDPVTSSVRAGVRDGDLSPALPLELELDDGPRGPATRLRIEPAWPLGDHRRHALLVGEAVRDPSGAGLVTDDGAWRRDLVTAGRGSSGPEANLVAPVPGRSGVPINVAAVETSFPVPVVAEASDVAWLEPDDAHLPWVALVDPEPCAGWVPGFCLRWSVSQELAPRTRYRPVDGTFSDQWGRPAVRAPQSGWFATGLGADTEAPTVDPGALRRRGPCVLASYFGEDARVELAAAGELDVAVGASVTVGVRIVGPTDAVLRVTDDAGNVAMQQADVPDPEAALRPDLVLTEVLANPLGPEPDQELVEVVARADASLAGLFLADDTWAEVSAALARGDDPPGDPLPAMNVVAGTVLVLVGEGYVPGAGPDPVPAAGSVVVSLDGSIAEGGLSNAGEPLTLYRAEPPALVSSYGNHVDTSAQSHAGRSVVRSDPARCDVESAWTSQGAGTSTPGRLP